MRRVAALYDIHGNLPALSAVLADVGAADVDAIVVGGDVASGPLPAETLDQLMSLGLTASFVMGNADRQAVASFDRGRAEEEMGGDDPGLRMDAFAASRISRRQRDFMSSFAPAVVLEIDGLGAVRFCHGSPRSDMEKLTPFTPDERWADVLGGVAEEVIVCGHTHRQFDVAVGGQRVINAGSVGLPYEGRAGLPSEGRAGAFWAVLGPEVELRRTDYPWAEALEELRRGGYPGLDELLLESLIQPMDPDEVSRFLES